jgi:hypothetical protein
MKFYVDIIYCAVFLNSKSNFAEYKHDNIIIVNVFEVAHLGCSVP